MFDDPKAWLARVEHARATLPYGQRPTDTHIRVAAKLAYWRGSTSPSHAQLARAAGCCPDTAQAALERLRDLGLLSWVERTAYGPGWCRRLSHSYAPVARKEKVFNRIYCSRTPPPPPPAAALEASKARALAAWNARRSQSRTSM